MENAIHDLIDEHRLPPEFYETVERWYIPIADDIAGLAKLSVGNSEQNETSKHNTIVLGVQGCQGSGKSTLSDFIKLLVGIRHSLTAAVLSIDDFYLTKSERNTLSEKIHPLLCTRGVPGTHDTKLAIDTINALSKLKSGEKYSIPRFNKAVDDRFPQGEWDAISGPIDIIILEGWCVGLDAQPPADLTKHTNELEQNEDADTTWRSYVNTCLANDYQSLFSMIDYTVMLAPPSFKCVFDWRLLQEEKLKEKLLAAGDNKAHDGIMNPEQIKRFISHYQRLTEHALITMPNKADWLLRLGEDHSITALEKNITCEETLDSFV